MKNYKGEIHGITVQKGGVGKSTMANGIAYQYAKQGYKTILIDIDPQATQTGEFMGFREKGLFRGDNESNITNLFYNKPITPLRIKTLDFYENPDKGQMHQPHYLSKDIYIDFIPSNPDLLKILEGDTLTKIEKIKLIENYLKSLKREYDKIVIDCPPSFGIITTAVINCSKSILIPIPTKNVDTGGMASFFEELDLLCETGDISLEKCVVVPNMHDRRVNDAKLTLSSIKLVPNLLQTTKNLKKLECVIAEPFPQNSSIQEAPSYNMFLVPFIMEYSRSKNLHLTLQLEKYADNLN